MGGDGEGWEGMGRNGRGWGDGGRSGRFGGRGEGGAFDEQVTINDFPLNTRTPSLKAIILIVMRAVDSRWTFLQLFLFPY